MFDGRDQTEKAVWMGEKVELDTSVLKSSHLTTNEIDGEGGTTASTAGKEWLEAKFEL